MVQKEKEIEISEALIEEGTRLISAIASKSGIDPLKLAEKITQNLTKKPDKEEVYNDQVKDAVTIEPKKFPEVMMLAKTRIGWAGKIVGGQQFDWQGTDSLTGTESRAIPVNFVDSVTRAREVLKEQSMRVIKSEKLPGYTLPITHTTLVSVAGRETPPLIRPTAVVITPEKLFNGSREGYRVGEQAYIATSNVLARPFARLSDSYVGFDYFAAVRRPIIFSMNSELESTKQKYGDHFEVLPFKKEDIVRSKDIALPTNWGLIEREDFEEKCLSILAVILASGKSAIDSGNDLIIQNIFDGNPASSDNIHGKLDFMRLVYDLSGVAWHFATNPIKVEYYGKTGLVFVDNVFLRNGDLVKRKSIPLNSGVQVSGKPKQIIDIIKDQVLKPAKASGFRDHPNTQLVRARKMIAEITSKQ